MGRGVGWRWLCCLGLIGALGCEREGAVPPGGDTPAGQSATTDAKKTADTGAAFVDVTDEVGLHFRHFTGAAGKFYFPEIMGSGCAVFDYDSDGDLDVYAVQGALLDESATLEQAAFPFVGEPPPRNRLFRNDLDRGGLHFTDVTDSAGVGDAGYGMGCAAGDYDNDGFVDLYVTNYGPNVLYRNNGDGTFTDVTATAGVGDPGWSASAAFADLTADGYLDLYVTNYVEWRPQIDRACYSPSGVRDYCSPLSYRPAAHRLYFQREGGLFEDVTAAAGIDRERGNGLGVVCADFNGDVRIDIYAANDGMPNFLWINQGDGTFKDEALPAGAAVNADGMPQAGMGVGVEDFDDDGDLDVFITHLRNEYATLYRNDGRGAFQDSSIEFGLVACTRAFTGFGTAWIDQDHDGQLDLFCANGAVYYLDALAGDPYPYHQTNLLLRRRPDGRFEDVSPRSGAAFAVSEVSRGAAFGDLDNDGDLDIVVSNNNGLLRVLRNTTIESGGRAPAPAAGHWLRVRLEGTRSNRSAIGARVALTLEGGRTLWRRVHSDGSYCSASDLRVHFGLGQADRCTDLVVHWPDGAAERFSAPGVDTEVHLREGQGAPVHIP